MALHNDWIPLGNHQFGKILRTYLKTGIIDFFLGFLVLDSY